MINNLKFNQKLWLITALLSLLVSFTGLINQSIYSKVVSQVILPGVISQDLITLIISIFLIYISLSVKKKDIKDQIIAVSLLAYIFYAYSVYSIEQLYNSYYLFYLLLASLSFWSIVLALANYDNCYIKEINLSKYIYYLLKLISFI